MKRLRLGSAPPDRTPCPWQMSALEQSIGMFAEEASKSVIKPELGLSFDSLGEAYDWPPLRAMLLTSSWPQKRHGMRESRRSMGTGRKEDDEEDMVKLGRSWPALWKGNGGPVGAVARG